jgi:hypothetical protein
VQGFPLAWSMRTMVSFGLYCKIYGNDANNIRQLCKHTIYIKLIMLNSQHINTWNVEPIMLTK